jgi:hypothetical protein
MTKNNTALKIAFDLFPNLGKIPFISYILWRDGMNGNVERKKFLFRIDEVIVFQNNFTILNPYNPNTTRTGWTGISGFKINGIVIHYLKASFNFS